MLANALDIIREEGINIEEIENIIFEGGTAACCTMKLMSPVSTEMLKKIKESSDILSVSHVAI